MLTSDKISLPKTKKKIIAFGVLNCAVYIILFMCFMWFNLLHFTGLRMLNYVSLFLISLYQINRWVKQIGTYIPSLYAFCTIFFTGACSFFLFAGFVLCSAQMCLMAMGWAGLRMQYMENLLNLSVLMLMCKRNRIELIASRIRIGSVRI